MEAIIYEYLENTKLPNFNDFVGKHKTKIVNLSASSKCTNTSKLMNLWINKYNKTVRKNRPSARLQTKCVVST